MSAENMGDQDGYQDSLSDIDKKLDCKIPIVLNPQDSNLPLQLEEKKSNRIKNLGEKRKGPWKPGQSGNPLGKPKGCGLKDELLRQLNKKGPDGITLRKKAVKKLLSSACDGEPWAQKILWDISGAADTLGIRNTGPLSIKFNIDGD
jgi:hypothetical protein